jgi:hypothetical protein
MAVARRRVVSILTATEPLTSLARFGRRSRLSRIKFPMALQLKSHRPSQTIEIRKQSRVRDVHSMDFSECRSAYARRQHQFGDHVLFVRQNRIQRARNIRRPCECAGLRDNATILKIRFPDGDIIRAAQPHLSQHLVRAGRARTLREVGAIGICAERRRVDCPHGSVGDARFEREKGRHIRRPSEVKESSGCPMMLHQRHPLWRISDLRHRIQKVRSLSLKYPNDTMFLIRPVPACDASVA